MQTTPPGQVPPGYDQVLAWKITEKVWRIIVMNVVALPLSAALAIGFILLAVGVGGPSATRFDGGALWLLWFLVSMLLVFPLHEWVHGLVMRAFGARPEYGFLWAGMAFYATASGYAFRRNHYLLIALAPLVGLTVLACLGMLLFHNSPVIWLLAAFGTLNGSGAIGDLWISAIVVRYPAHAFVIDEKDGIRVFLPAAEG